MNGNVAPSCRTGGARQRWEHEQAPVAAAIVLWLRTSLNPIPSCRTRIGGDRTTHSSNSWPCGDAESPKVAQKEASP